MATPLNASSNTAGALISNSTFEVPPFQREYSWTRDEVTDFWTDLRNSLSFDYYFLGLIILTGEAGRKRVVDGQQRLLTLTLLATALYHEALRHGRQALADRIQADFLRAIDYDSDATEPRVKLSDQADDATLQHIIATGTIPSGVDEESVSARMCNSFEFLRTSLVADLVQDPFKRLGRWTDFITNKLYFAVFLHQEATSAYQVYEVINTRGRDLTTADLLKNYVLSQAGDASHRYKLWQAIAKQFPSDGANNFVQYIRHAVTVNSGHVLPKDLFGFLAGRLVFQNKVPPTADQLMELLSARLPLYSQMIDPTAPGPAEGEMLGVFTALNSLGVIAVRPILMAIFDVPDALDGMRYVLRLVVRRIVVGNLGTGNIERRFGEAAKAVHDSRNWQVLEATLSDLNPPKEQFLSQLTKRSFNKGSLTFLRRSAIQRSMTPSLDGVLHFIWTRQTSALGQMSEEDASFWSSTMGNTFLSELERRPPEASTWDGFKRHMLPTAVQGELRDALEAIETWDATAIEAVGSTLAEVAGDVWY